MSVPVEQAAPPRPQALSPKTETIPDGLKGYGHFLVWDWRLREGKDGPVWTKPPLKVTGTGNARSTEPGDWGSFAAAVDAYRGRKLAGIGFALAADDPFVFGDVDDCRDPETGEIAAWATPLLARFAFTYQEVSPSGTGVKIIAKGTLPGTEHRWKLGDGTGEYVEWFDRGKYTTLTGHRLDGAAADIADASSELARLHRELFPPDVVRGPVAVRGASRGSAVSGPLGDGDVLRIASNAKNGDRFRRLYFEGEVGDHQGNHSCADEALLCHLVFYTRDPVQVERLFARSALGRRDKWAKRADYRKRSIDRALGFIGEQFVPSSPKQPVQSGPVPVRRAGGHRG